MNRRLRRWSVDQLEGAVKKSVCVTDVLRELGLGIAGGNHVTIKRYIAELEIDISHFDPNKKRISCSKDNKKYNTEEDVFCNPVKCATTTLRRWAKKIIPYKCHICPLTNEWNGGKLVLQLDHINGNKEDCRKENLRWLCPNCHSQTETFAGRKLLNNSVKSKKLLPKRLKKVAGVKPKKLPLERVEKAGISKNIYYCRCGNEKDKYAKRCNNCFRIDRRLVKTRPTKEEIDVMLETMSWCAIGRKYGVSDNAIRKWYK